MQRFDPIAVIQQGYRHAGDLACWWRGLAEVVAPMLDRGPGMFAYRLPLGSVRPTGFVDLGASPVLTASPREGALDPGRRAAVLAVDPAGLYASSEVFGEIAYPPGIADALALSIPDGEGAMHVLVAPSARREQVSEAERMVWKRLALHLGAGIRLQRQAGTLEDAEVEAVLTVHANAEQTTGESREQLRETTRQIDRMRRAGRRESAHEALELWQGLLLGRWSMVDHFDSDGRHFLVARRNDPDAPAPRQLTRRQRQVVFYASLGFAYKQIGYALGLAEPTIATHLRGALDKLGVRTREELIAMVAHLVTPEHPGGTPA